MGFMMYPGGGGGACFVGHGAPISEKWIPRKLSRWRIKENFEDRVKKYTQDLGEGVRNMQVGEWLERALSEVPSSSKRKRGNLNKNWKRI